MYHFKSLGIAMVSALLLFSSAASAQDRRYLNIHQATHISDGWVAYSNGDLYKCEFPQGNEKGAPECVIVSGLPSDLQSVSSLWAEDDVAWVIYTDGKIYGCRPSPSSKHDAPKCLPAVGLP